ncbi:MAG: hypothetical protein ACOZNI_19465 [Myxococcota bacterium]
MTRRLLLALGELHVGLGLRLALALLVLLALPFTIAWDALTARRRRALEAEAFAAPFVVCPSGHPVGLVGGWTCPMCCLTYEGNGFLCPHCGRSPAAIRCACGLSVRSPLWVPE